MIDLSTIRAIGVHMHAEESCPDPEGPVMAKYFDAASAYFKAPRARPKIPEIIDIYREQQIAFCLFTVDCESSIGAKRVSNPGFKFHGIMQDIHPADRVALA